MDKKTVFVKTIKGKSEVANQTDFLYGDAKRVLLLVDDDSTVGDITKRAPPSLRVTLEKELQDLLNGGFIRDSKTPEDEPQKQGLKFATPKFATPKAAAARFDPPKYEAPKAAAPQAAAPRVEPPKAAPPAPTSAAQSDQDMELDFSFLTSTPPPKPASPPPAAVTSEAAKPAARVEPAAKPQSEAEIARAKAAQLAQIEATAAAAKAKAYAEAKAKAKAEVEIRARAEAEARAKQAAETARLKAEQEASQARAELEAAKAKAEAELRARAVAAARIKQEAEAARLKAEQEAARARSELEAAKAKMEAEIRSRVEAEARAKQEAEAARLRAEQEAERVRAELEAARIKAEAEARARVESEARVKAEIEARHKLEAEEARLKAERELAEVRAKHDAEKSKEEAEAKARAEAEVRIKAEVDARIKREAEEARLKVEREEAEARLKMAAEARIRAEVEAQILREEEDARLQAAKLLVEMDAIKAKAEADAKALVDAAARIKAEADARQKQEEEAARLKAEKERADALIDPAEKIRLSFAQSTSASQGNQRANAPAFKFDSFALGGVDQAAAATIPPHKLPAGGAPVPVINLGNFDGVAGVPARETATPAAGGSKVKAAMEQRAQKEAEAQRVKAEQEAAARLKAEQEAARIAAAEESARLKAEHEAYRAKVEQEEARAKAEQEARKQADEQGKAWEEAEQRARAKAQAEKERLERQQAEAQTKAVSKPPKARRKPLPLGKIAGALLVMAMLVIAVLPYVWPLESYVQPIEQELSAHLRQPVHIGKINAALFPSPRLELADVSVGGARELKIRNVVVNFDFSALFSPTRSINQLQLNDISLKGNVLPAAMTWFKSAGGIEQYPVARMELQNVRVESDEIKLPLVSGHAAFNAQGAFTKAEMKSEDGRFGFELESVQKHLQLVVNFKDGNLPLLPSIPFTDLSATGEVLNGEIVFSDIYAHLYGGMLGGNARLNWQNGWLLQGRLIAKSLELKNMFSQFGITGELYGDVNVTMSGAKLAQLGDAPRMEGTFEAKKVDINKIDLETIARFGNRSDVGRGHTSFDEIKGSLQADSQGQRLRQLELSSGVLSATGTMDVASDQQISGKLSVDLKGARGGNVVFLLSGTPVEPVVKTR